MGASVDGYERVGVGVGEGGKAWVCRRVCVKKVDVGVFSSVGAGVCGCVKVCGCR